MSDDQLRLAFDADGRVDDTPHSHVPLSPPAQSQPAQSPPAQSPPPRSLPPVPAATESPFRVEVTRSKKRKRSVGAQLVGDTLRVAIPSWMSHAEETHWVTEMSRRFARKMSSDRIDLPARASGLAKRYGFDRPTEVRWAVDMTTRWGSCTPDAGTIRISDRIAAFPDWVVDYVIVHELAHLHVGGHGADFWHLVHRYPRAERAIGYLIAKSGDGDQDLQALQDLQDLQDLQG